MSARDFRKLRPWVQLAAFLLFIGLLILAGRIKFPPADLFFRLDPLVGLASMIAARHIVPALLIGSGVTLVATLILGRAWCGWLCPLGAILDWTPARHARRFEPDPAPRLRQVKYFLLALIGGAALLGNLTFLILDPITLLYRTAVTAAWPGLIALISALETLLYKLSFLQAPIDWFEGTVRGTLLPMTQPVYGLGIWLALIFVGTLALNAVRNRFWCRYLCPLGALLGLVSKIAWLRRTMGDACIDCQRCARACPTGTIDPQRRFASDPAECTMCLECMTVCTRSGGQQFTGHLRPAVWQPYDPSRRQFIASAGAAVAAVGLFAAEPAAVRDNPRLIRPPGAQGREFPSICIRCGICVKVCPTSGLQPSFGQAGWAGVWTPILVPRLGYCDYSCNACGQACPVAAIPSLVLEAKRQTVIGHAYIDRSCCLPWVDNRNCLVCEEMCPLPEKAILLDDVVVQTPAGETVNVRRPVVLHDRCIGCGICENRCPLNGEAAIRVYAPTDLSATG